MSVLFADVVGSTALGYHHEPELVRSALAAHFARLRGIAQAHGGTIEKYIGDAVMVVFGVPQLHADDPERAVRAALAMRDAVDTAPRAMLSLAVRFGVATGEVVTDRSASDQFLITGDVVNVAARLQSAAAPGEVLVDELTASLTRAAVDLDPRPDLTIPGRDVQTKPFAARGARTPEPQRSPLPMQADFVGRDREVQILKDVLRSVVVERRAHFVTVLGEPGIGKSRVAAELVRAAPGLRIVHSRCLPYGVGVTYWPVVDIVRSDAGIVRTDDRATSLAKIGDRLARLLPFDGERRAVEARLTLALGLTPLSALPDVAPESLPAEIGWGLRRYLEMLARETPTIVVIDDLHHAEDAMIDALRRVRSRSLEEPLLVLALARPELAGRDVDWGAADPSSTVVSLGPLAYRDSARLVSRLLNVAELPEELAPVVADRSGGNPLFCGEMVRMLTETGRLERTGDRWVMVGIERAAALPETIHALIAARIDTLPQHERAVLQAASVIGERFARASLVSLLRGDASTLSSVDALERRGLFGDVADGPRGEIRFGHLLVREVAYGSLAKVDRAELHERYGELLEQGMGDRRDEVVAILSYHAERAFSFSLELRLPPEVVERRARRSLDLALSLAERARDRRDRRLLQSVLEPARAATAAIPGGGGEATRSRLLVAEAEDLALAGQYERAREAAVAAVVLADRAGRHDIAAGAQLLAARIERFGGSREADFQRELERAVAFFDAADDPRGRLDAGLLALEVFFGKGDLTAMLRRGKELHDEAVTSGDRGRAAAILVRLVGAATYAGRPDDAAAYAAQSLPGIEEFGLHAADIQRRHYLCRLMMFKGALDDAVSCFGDVTIAAREQGDRPAEVRGQRALAETLLELERWPEARDVCERAIAEEERGGDRWNRAELLSSLAIARLNLGDLAGAERAAADADAAVREGDVTARVAVDRAFAMLRARQDRHDESERHFRRGLAAIEATDFVPLSASLALDFAQQLLAHGEASETARLVHRASAVLERSGYGFRSAQIGTLTAALERKI